MECFECWGDVSLWPLWESLNEQCREGFPQCQRHDPMSAQAGTDRRLVGNVSGTNVAQPWESNRIKRKTPSFIESSLKLMKSCQNTGCRKGSNGVRSGWTHSAGHLGPPLRGLRIHVYIDPGLREVRCAHLTPPWADIGPPLRSFRLALMRIGKLLIGRPLVFQLSVIRIWDLFRVSDFEIRILDFWRWIRSERQSHVN